MRIIAAVLACLLVCACAGPPPSQEQRAATDLNPSGRPYVGPKLYQPQALSSTNGFDPLYCHPEGPGTVCKRQAE